MLDPRGLPQERRVPSMPSVLREQVSPTRRLGNFFPLAPCLADYGRPGATGSGSRCQSSPADVDSRPYEDRSRPRHTEDAGCHGLGVASGVGPHSGVPTVMSQVHVALFSVYVAVGLFIGMLCLLEVGRRVGQRRRAADIEGARAGVGVVDGAVFALLGLLLAFTFSGAAALR